MSSCPCPVRRAGCAVRGVLPVRGQSRQLSQPHFSFQRESSGTLRCAPPPRAELTANAAPLLLSENEPGARPLQPGAQNARGIRVVPARCAPAALLRAPVGSWHFLQE